MKSNVKPGDLARIIYPGYASPLTDRIVFVEREAKVGDIFTSIDGKTTALSKKTREGKIWVISSKSPMDWPTLAGVNRFYLQRALNDHFLRRLGGDGLLNEDTETEKPLEKTE